MLLKNLSIQQYLLFVFISLLCSSCSVQSEFNSFQAPAAGSASSTSFFPKQNKLTQAIDLTFQTDVGRQLKSAIDELLLQDKIHLKNLPQGHYGESGEGCTIKEGQYFYEGFFIFLNERLSIEELASALVHEATHYQMIKASVLSSIEPQQQVIFFETSAFSVQYQFIEELEKLNLVDRHDMFVGETQTVSDIMKNSYRYKDTALAENLEIVFNQLVAFGYPAEELNRLISQRSEQACVGYE